MLSPISSTSSGFCSTTDRTTSGRQVSRRLGPAMMTTARSPVGSQSQRRIRRPPSCPGDPDFPGEPEAPGPFLNLGRPVAGAHHDLLDLRQGELCGLQDGDMPTRGELPLLGRGVIEDGPQLRPYRQAVEQGVELRRGTEPGHALVTQVLEVAGPCLDRIPALRDKPVQLLLQ